MLLETFGYVLWRFLFLFLKVSPSGSFPPPLGRAEEQELFVRAGNGEAAARENSFVIICAWWRIL